MKKGFGKICSKHPIATLLRNVRRKFYRNPSCPKIALSSYSSSAKFRNVQCVRRADKPLSGEFVHSRWMSRTTGNLLTEQWPAILARLRKWFICALCWSTIWLDSACHYYWPAGIRTWTNAPPPQVGPRNLPQDRYAQNICCQTSVPTSCYSIFTLVYFSASYVYLIYSSFSSYFYCILLFIIYLFYSFRLKQRKIGKHKKTSIVMDSRQKQH